MAPISVARSFSMEFHPERCVRKNGGSLPFGCHAWYRYSPDFYVRVLAKFGYDISPHRERMKEDDLMALRFFLQNTAWNRLLRNIQRGVPVRLSLPRMEYQSFRVIRSPRALLVLAVLAAMGEQPMARECYFYENGEGLQLLQDMKQAGGCHLLLTEGDDGAFLQRMAQEGLRYGEHVVSFYQEYMRSQQELLHRLGT